MTLLSVADACRLLAIDPKTLRRWLAQAQFPLQPHPSDGRLKGVSSDHLRLLAQTHHRSLAAVPEEPSAPVPTGPAAEPSPLPTPLLTLSETLGALQAQIATLQQQVAELTQLLQQSTQQHACPPAPAQQARAPKPAPP